MSKITFEIKEHPAVLDTDAGTLHCDDSATLQFMRQAVATAQRFGHLWGGYEALEGVTIDDPDHDPHQFTASLYFAGVLPEALKTYAPCLAALNDEIGPLNPYTASEAEKQAYDAAMAEMLSFGIVF